MVPLLLGGWFTTIAKMKNATDTGKSRIEGAIEIGPNIMRITPHPNIFSKEGLEKSENEISAEW